MHSPLGSRRIAAISLALATIAFAACGGTDATIPQVPLIPPGTAQAPLASADVQGAGGVSVTTKAIPEGYFDADISVHVVNARPSTTYIVQRAPEVGRALGNDGVCQRALGLAPWSSADPAAPTFISFVLPGESSPVHFTTSASGEGSVTFDVMFRLLND